MYLLYFLISLLATTIGAICGVGGGIVIKPVLDATRTLSVSDISFLSGCTVLSMTVISVFRNRKVKGVLDIKISTALAIGGAIGGAIGKYIFELAKSIFHHENYLGAAQAALLILITVGSLIYSINSDKIKTYKLNNIFACCIIGLSLGTISAFLGIGGGPINLTVLFFFFSMETKKAAANSLYIILFSQFTSLSQTVINGSIPPVSIAVLILMIVAGIIGGCIGSNINKIIAVEVVDRLFIAFMAVVICINIYNFYRFIF